MINLPSSSGYVITGNIFDGTNKPNKLAINVGTASSNGKIGVNTFMNIPVDLWINNLSPTTFVNQ